MNANTISPTRTNIRPNTAPGGGGRKRVTNDLGSSPFLQSSYDKLVLKKLKKMTKSGHTVNHPLTNLLNPDPIHTKPDMDVLPIPLHVKAKLRHKEISIARAEYAIARVKREAVIKGDFYLTQIQKALANKDKEQALVILAAARKCYKKGEDSSKIDEVNALHVKIKGEYAMNLAMECRLQRDYDKAVEHVSEALFHFKVLSGVTSVDRDMANSTAGRMEKESRTYLRIRDPKKYVRKLAIEDGEEARAQVIAFLDERKYGESKTNLADAKVCFDWAEIPDSETGMSELKNHIALSESASAGDGLLEEIAANLKPVVKKDYEFLLEKLELAQKAYEGAYDDAGVKVVMRMKSCLAAIRAGDVAWYNLAHSLLDNSYSDASSSLITVRKCLYLSSLGLPFVNKDMDRILGVALNEDLRSLEMIAELASRDGEVFMAKAKASLENQDLDAAASNASSAVKCFEWVAGRRKLLSERSKEDFGVDDEEVMLDVTEMKNVPDSKLCVDLMERITSIFPTNKEETFQVNVHAAGNNIGACNDVLERISKSHSLLKAESHMDKFFDREEQDKFNEAFENLDMAKTIYQESGFTDYANDVLTIKVNSMGDIAAEKAAPFLTQGKHAEAQQCLREAMRHYENTDNRTKFEATKTALVTSQGDQLLVEFDKSLDKSNYDKALELGLQVVELYEKSGDAKRINAIGDPKFVVWKRAVNDADSLKMQALAKVDEKNLEEARKLALSAKDCLTWSGESGETIDDVFAVITMAEKRWKGDEVMEKALEHISDPDREESKKLLALATSAYQEAQLAYQQLMGRAAEIMANKDVDPSFGLELQDNVTKIYNVCVDGVKVANLQNIELALRADERLDEVAVLIRHELFSDAKELIENVRGVYFSIGLKEDNERILKTSTMLELVEYGVKYYDTVAHKQFEESKEHIQKCKDLLEKVSGLPPKTIKALPADVFGDQNAADTVIVRAVVSGEKDLEDAKDYLKKKEFVRSLKECDKAMRSYNWVSQYKDFSEIAPAVKELEEFIELVKREQAYSEGEACCERAAAAMEEQKFPFAVMKYGEAVESFVKSGKEEKVVEAKKLKALANGSLFEQQSNVAWAAKEFDKGLEKALKGVSAFEEAADEGRRQKMFCFSKRVEGDLIMEGYNQALKDCDWDRACKVMSDAHDCYNSSNDPKIMSLIEGVVPKTKVIQAAMRKGDELKLEAGSILHKGGGTANAQAVLDRAKVCFIWSDVSLSKAGINMVQKDIESGEMEEQADVKLKKALEYWSEEQSIGDGGCGKSAVRSMKEAKDLFKRAGPGCFKHANDTSYIINVMESAAFNSLKPIEEMLVAENVMDALAKCTDTHSSWNAVVRIQNPCKSLKPFVEFYLAKEQQLSLVIGLLNKTNQISAEISNNKWNPPPVAMCEELIMMYEGLEKKVGEWKLTFRFEFLQPLVEGSKLACGLVEKVVELVVEPVVVEPEVVEPEVVEVVEEPKVEEEVVDEVGEEGAGYEDEEFEKGESQVEEVGEEGEGEADLASKLANAEGDYEDDEFDTSLESSTKTAQAPPVVVPDAGIEVIDATNKEDEDEGKTLEKLANAENDYGTDDFESSLESSQQTQSKGGGGEEKKEN
ncbi:hypothetical protein TL16_g13093 [Triparma laevis f. inornata]|uniref:Uncharacterized protein n=1 Tax=Triparma laevis f. inornata TaxID=1714386 RepID=A0A9W7BZC7_9STRA|nr:hypothetical protein TL16_g13093 [Triparma laevis f. inornata]